jgi:hypothetical protein
MQQVFSIEKIFSHCSGVWLATFFFLPETRRSNNGESKPLLNGDVEKEVEKPVIRKERDDSDDIYAPSSKLWTWLTFCLCLSMFLHWWCMFGFMQVRFFLDLRPLARCWVYGPVIQFMMEG